MVHVVWGSKGVATPRLVTYCDEPWFLRDASAMFTDPRATPFATCVQCLALRGEHVAKALRALKGRP